MGKQLRKNDLNGRWTSRPLLAVSLAASLAAFGCTTNQNLGNGTPSRTGGELRSAPTSGVTSGQERATPPPMISSYTSASALAGVAPRSASRADRAAAIMAGHQAVRGRYLGVVNPGSSGRGYVSDRNIARTSQPPNPAMLTNPQITINSSLTSGPTVGIVNGGGGGGAVIGGSGFTGVTGAATATGATAAAVVGADVPLGSPAVGPALPAGAFAATTLSPTAAVTGLPSVTAASVGAGRTGGVAPLATSAVDTTATTAASGTTVTNAGTATPVTAALANSSNVTTAGGVRLVRGTNGRATITNTSATGRGQ